MTALTRHGSRLGILWRRHLLHLRRFHPTHTAIDGRLFLDVDTTVGNRAFNHSARMDDDYVPFDVACWRRL